MGNALSIIGGPQKPPSPFYERGSYEKIQPQQEKAYPLGRGRDKFMPSKPAGDAALKSVPPDFRQATPAASK
jgi:hypothetical protein